MGCATSNDASEDLTIHYSNDAIAEFANEYITCVLNNIGISQIPVINKYHHLILFIIKYGYDSYYNVNCHKLIRGRNCYKIELDNDGNAYVILRDFNAFETIHHVHNVDIREYANINFLKLFNACGIMNKNEIVNINIPCIQVNRCLKKRVMETINEINSHGDIRESLYRENEKYKNEIITNEELIKKYNNMFDELFANNMKLQKKIADNVEKINDIPHYGDKYKKKLINKLTNLANVLACDDVAIEKDDTTVPIAEPINMINANIPVANVVLVE